MSRVCAQCAAALDEGASLCAQCGTTVPSPDPVSYAPSFTTLGDLEGIGGWLILAAIGLGISPLSYIHGTYVTLHVLYGSQFQFRFATHPGLAALILYEAVTNSFFLIAVLALNYLFYCKKKQFPSLMITFLALHLILILIDHVVTLHFHPRSSVVNVLSSILGAAIWIPYYLVSERVKATFVR
jgi:hypothetical protein